jgi:hypothetical protein
MFHYTKILLFAFGLLLAVQADKPASAQQAGDLLPPAAAGPRAGPKAGTAIPEGPIVYVVDLSGVLGTVDIATRAVRVIGATGLPLTDIGFDPNGVLYGITSTGFYRIDRNTARPTFIGSLGASGMTALICGGRSKCFGASSFVSNLFEIDARTGRARSLGLIGTFRSAGDLAFFQRGFVLSTSNLNLVTLSRTGQVSRAVPIGFPGVFGLASINNVIYGFAGTSIYRIDPLTGRTSFVGSYAGRGLGANSGASYSIRTQR